SDASSLPPILPHPPSLTLFPYTTLFRSRFPLSLVHAHRLDRPRRPVRPRDAVAGGGRAGRRALLAGVRGSCDRAALVRDPRLRGDRKSTRLNSSHVKISYAVFCLKKKKQ